MNRLHVHLKVSDIEQSVNFYSALFGRAPDKREADYAKWMLEDPRANIAISARGGAAGVDHVGIETDARPDLEAIAGRLKHAEIGLQEEADATCCYARSNKYWTASPDGTKWELYHTFADSRSFGADPAPLTVPNAIAGTKNACCG